MMNTGQKLTIPDLAANKKAKERLAMVAVGDFLSADWGSMRRYPSSPFPSKPLTVSSQNCQPYDNIAEIATQAFENYTRDVKAGTFPDTDHSYTIKPEEAAKPAHALAGERK